ncbi:MAG TPA: HAD family hydrolase [Gammaproteobacteria bacterium]|jgi:putative hydrolase of the HAD superfamily|nr:HAD family hydrolase [Gammaproteobacteria bacterium]
MKIKFPDISLDGVEAVLIDLDDTLYLYQPAHDYAIAQCYVDEVATHFSREAFFTLYKKAREEITRALYPQSACRSRLFALQKLFQDKNIPQSYVLALKFEALYWQAFLSEMKLEEAAANFLVRCQAQGVAVCVVTDMLAAVQIQKLQRLQVTPYIQYVVTSEEAGSEKPHPSIFKLALRRLNVLAGKAIMIGDSFTKDIEGAQALGLGVYQVELVHE